MGEPKFTPGPWQYVPREFLSHDAPEWEVTVARGGIMGGHEDDPSWVIDDASYISSPADARLIAAAPELFKALRAVVNAIMEGDDQSAFQIAKDAGTAALSKAGDPSHQDDDDGRKR